MKDRVMLGVWILGVGIFGRILEGSWKDAERILKGFEKASARIVQGFGKDL